MTDADNNQAFAANGFGSFERLSDFCDEYYGKIQYSDVQFSNSATDVRVYNANVETKYVSGPLGLECGDTISIDGGFEVELPDLVNGRLVIATSPGFRGVPVFESYGDTSFNLSSPINGKLTIVATDGSAIALTPDTDDSTNLLLSLTYNDESHSNSVSLTDWLRDVFRF